MSLTIQLPDELKIFLEEQVASGRYRSASEYVQELIREEQQRAAEDADLEAKLLAGLNSGPATEVTPEFWDDFRARLRERFERKKAL